MTGIIPAFELKRQYHSIREEIDRKIQDVLASGEMILGENVSCFERQFSGYCNAGFGIGTGSGTEALHLALLSCGIGGGDEVITAPNTAVPTVSAISLANASPIFVDVDPETYTIDAGGIEEGITGKTRAIIPVHLFGHPCDMDPVMEIAERHGLRVIEDACQAHGTEYKGRRVGSIGDVGCFSFYPTKNLGAYGDGGMAVTNNEEIAERLRLLRNYGQTEKNVHRIIGFNSRLDEIQAAVLRVKLRHLEEWNERRRRNAGLYRRHLGPGVIMPLEREWARHVYHLYVIRSGERDRLQAWLKSRGISTGIHYPSPVHMQEAYRHLGYKRGSFPVSEGDAGEMLSLPMFPELTRGEIERVADAVNGFGSR